MVGRWGIAGLGALVVAGCAVLSIGQAGAEMDTIGIHDVMRAEARAARRFVPVNAAPVPLVAPVTVAASAPRMSPRRTAPTAAPAAGGLTAVCVRLCDGYSFPVGPAASQSRAQASCEAGCPGAPVRLFTLRGGMDALEGAVDAGGMSYRALPTAFLHRSQRVAGCSCQGPDRIAARLPLHRDGTLRPGDVFVTPNSALAVVGAAEARRFVDFRRAESLTRGQRAQVDAALGVSRREAEVKRFRQAFVAQGGRITVVEAPKAQPAATGQTLAALAPARGFAPVERATGTFRVVR